MVPVIFLAVSAWGALFTLASMTRLRRPAFLLFPYFMTAWITGELALFHLAWQVVATIVFIALGALRAWPGWIGLGITLCSWGGLVLQQRRAAQAPAVLEDALRAGLGADYFHAIDEDLAAKLPDRVRFGQLVRPFHFKDRTVERISDLSYGPAGRRNLLDIYRLADGGVEKMPVLLQVHGGGWVYGHKQQQALPLMYHLAARGWICVSINYRLGPRATWPDPIVDVKRAIAWIREHIAEYGGDPNFLTITGGSAGGHLASLAALTPNDPEYQPGFEGADTTVDACVPLYGVYDLLDRNGSKVKQGMEWFLTRVLMKRPPAEAREMWDRASPVCRVNPDSPPMFVIHGTYDSLVFIDDAHVLVEKLRSVSKAAVVYAEVPGAQHAFDVFHSVRADATVNAIGRFLAFVYSAHIAAARRAS
ncbi:MAG: alpha/beta hydrolase [Actinobacteria bacterium]|nr:alpha/beta hydrolase [Actinomycetota bacterium]